MMRDTEIAVRFQPSGKVVYVLPGTRLAEAAAMAGLVLDVPCGGEGICGKCKVRVQEGACPATAADTGLLAPPRSWPRDTAWLARRRSPTRSRWKCRKCSLPAAYHKILTETEDVGAEILEPAIRKQYVELPPPSRDDDAPDQKRLQRAVGRFEVDLELAAASCRIVADERSFVARRCWPTRLPAAPAGCWTSSPATRSARGLRRGRRRGHDHLGGLAT